MAQQIARRHQIIQRVDEGGRRALSLGGHGARHRDRVTTALNRGQEQRHAHLAFALKHAVDGARAVLDDRASGERGAMPADADKHLRKTGLRLFGKIDNLGDVRQIIAGEGDDVRPPAFERSEIRAVVFDLQIDQLDLMSRLPRRLSDEFKADRLKPQKEL
jgi:hypothetical protein